MILPIGDKPNARGAAPVTWFLIALNVVAYLFVTVPLSTRAANVHSEAFREYVETVDEMTGGRVDVYDLARGTSAYDLFVFEHGFRPASPTLGDLLLSLFLHGGLLHLVGNMLFLWIYGDNVERRLGPLAFLVAYLGTGVAATAFHALFALGSQIPVVGASGAISGVLGFYFLWFPKNRVRLLVLLPPFFFQVVEIPARLVLGFYLAVDNLLPLLLQGSDQGVAHGAHIGGFLAGAAAAWLLDRRALGRSTWQGDIPLEEHGAPGIRALIEAGQFGEAATAYFALPQGEARNAISPEEAVDLAMWLRDTGHTDAALLLLRRVVRDWPSPGPGVAEAHLLAGLILLDDRHESTAAYQYFLATLELDPEPEVEAAARRALERIAALQKLSFGRRLN